MHWEEFLGLNFEVLPLIFLTIKASFTRSSGLGVFVIFAINILGVTVEFLNFLIFFREFSLALLMNVQRLSLVSLAIVELFDNLVLLTLGKTPSH